MLSKIWCLASCGQFVHLYLFHMKSNAIFHFYCSLYLLISGALIEFNRVVLLSGLPGSQQFGKHLTNFSKMRKIMISYRLKYNRYRYFFSTGIPRIPTVDDEICKAFAIWHWGTLFLKYSTIFLCTLSQIGEPLPIRAVQRPLEGQVLKV